MQSMPASHHRRHMLLLGASLIALGTVPLLTTQAIAEPVCSPTTIANDTVLGSNVSCVEWNGGNITLNTGSTISSQGTISAITGQSSLSDETLTNNGHISGYTGVTNTGNASIARITNSGTIASFTTSNGSISTSNHVGIRNTNTSTIAEIVNSGLISGTVAGIQNDLNSQITLINNQASGSITSTGTAIYNKSNGGSVTSIQTITNDGNISGGNAIVNEKGSMTLIDNSGSITGTGAGILSSGGTIGTISNSGTIHTYSHALNMQINGSIATQVSLLENSGLIQSDNGYALVVARSGTVSSQIGTIINSGTIAGNIINATPNGLLINGNINADSFGTLTGSSGSISSGAKGTISHMLADLTFGSGNILLNDDIDVSGYRVNNTGATLKLVNAISIIGDYTQSAGGLISQVNGSINGSLAVAGNATINGTTTLVIQGSGLKSGDSYIVVNVGGTGNYSISSASVTGTNGLTASTSISGENLIVTLEGSGGGKYTAPAQTSGGAGKGFGAVLDTINGENSAAAQSFQTNILAKIDSLPAGSRGSAIRQLAPADAANNLQISNQSNAIVINAVETRQQLTMNEGTLYEGKGKAAGSGTRDRALWGQILGGSAHRAGDADSDGFTSKSFGLTTGLDNLFTPNMLGGVALSWLRSWSDGSNNSSGSSTELDSYQLTFYGSYRQNRLNVDGQLGAAWNKFDQERAINFLGDTAKADYDGQQYSAFGRVGYDFTLSQDAIVTPFAGLRWLHARNDAYQETGAGAANNSVDSQNSDSVTHEIGAKAAWQFDTEMGALSPQVSLAWIHDYTSSALETTGQIGGTAYRIESERLAADGAKLSLGLGLASSDSLDFRLQYDGELRSGYQAQTATFRTTWHF